MPILKASRYRLAVNAEGWCYLAVLVLILLAALIRDINLLLLLFGMLVGPLAFSWAAVVVSLRRVVVERRLPDELAAGEPFDVELHLTNGKRYLNSWAVTVDDRIVRLDGRGAHDAVEGGVLFFRTEPGQTSRGAYRVRLAQRGKYRFGPVTVSSQFPLGLLRRSMGVDDVATVVVLPRLGQMQPGWMQLGAALTHASRHSDRRLGLREGEFLGLREWRSGDSSRWIHWRTTARKGELMVRQFERRQNHDLALLVDLWQPAAPTPAHLERVELAVSMAATLLRETCRQGGGRLWIATAGRQFALFQGAASLALLRDGLERLAVVEADDHQRLGALVAAAHREVPRGARCMLISTRPLAAGSAGAPEGLDHRFADKLMQPIEIVDVGSPQFDRYFQPA